MSPSKKRDVQKLGKLDEVVADFLEYMRFVRRMSEHTVRAYAADLRDFLSVVPEKKLLRPLNPGELRDFAAVFLSELYERGARPSTAARKLSTLKSFVRYLSERVGMEIKLPFKTPKQEDRLPKAVPEKIMMTILQGRRFTQQYFKFPRRDLAIIDLLYSTGARCSELVGINLQDISLNDRMVRLRGKGDKERIAVFGRRAAARLKEYLETERPLILGATDCEALFINARKTRLSQRAVQMICERVANVYELDVTITPHVLRHSFATHLVARGMDIRLVQELLGHSRLSTTEIYTRISTRELADACRKSHLLNSSAVLEMLCHSKTGDNDSGDSE